MQSLLVIGLGNMGKALVKGMIGEGFNPERIHAVDISEQAKTDANALGIHLHTEPPAIEPDLVLIAIKPQLIEHILPLYKGYKNCVFLSIAAGTTLQKMQTILGDGAAIIRSMPNTPAAIGKGMTVLFANNHVTEPQKKLATALTSSVGEAAWVSEEKHLDAVTAVSGSGPAYFFLMMEALTAAGVTNGLPQELAQKLAVTTAWGAGALAKHQAEDYSPAQLREMVTSPNGTTAAGLDSLYKSEFGTIIEKAVTAARKRSEELA